MKESFEKKKSRLKDLVRRFRKLYPHSKTSLNFENPFELTVATILSAQCTDARVNIVTPNLFKKFPSPAALAQAPIPEVEKLIHSTGFYRNKAKNIVGMAQAVMKNFGGQIPSTMEELRPLPGVGRKTANCVLGNAFGKPEGVVVDTHVKRLSFRLGLSKHTNPEKVEKDLNELVPKENWVNFSHWLIDHGRRICTARNPQCSACEVVDLCPRIGLPKL